MPGPRRVLGGSARALSARRELYCQEGVAKDAIPGGPAGSAQVTLGPVPGGYRWYAKLLFAGDPNAVDPTANIAGTFAWFVGPANAVGLPMDIAVTLPLAGPYGARQVTLEQGESFVGRFYQLGAGSGVVRGVKVLYAQVPMEEDEDWRWGGI